MDDTSCKRKRISPSPSTQTTPPLPLPPLKRKQLEPSIYNYSPLDPTVKAVQDFFCQHLNQNTQHLNNIEIEAKLGILIDKRSQDRIYLPIASETVINPKDCSWVRFESNMHLEQHKHFNALLNERADVVNKARVEAPIIYKHTKERDQFYGKTRVTRDLKTNEIVPGGIVQKRSIARLEIYSPATNLDYRISINCEEPRPLPEGAPTFERIKDRISYTHQVVKVDLTQVRTHAMNAAKAAEVNGVHADDAMTHELEIEYVNPARDLVAEKVKMDQGLPNNLMQMIQVLINNCRIRVPV